MNSLRTLSALVLAGLLAACGQSEDVPTSTGGGSSGHSAANQGYKKANKKAKLDDLENADLQAIQDVFAASNISNMEVRQNAKNWSYKAGFEPSCSAYQSFYNSQRLLYADIAPKIQALKLQTVLGKELVATLAPALDLAATEALLRQVCAYLNIPPAPEVNRPRDVLDWAVANWNMARVPKQAICTE